jgi:cytochrome c oxidase assembly protein subunit 15
MSIKAALLESEARALQSRRAIAVWLFAICGLVALMILVGGLTRLTDSGLSITEWRPITGTVPPLSDAEWQAEFERYRQIPEYKLVNRGMSLDEFKTIYWWEWAHRFLGRLVGVVFLGPFAVFLIKGWIPRPLIWRLLALFALGGLQGALGWFMVQSGLTDRVDVSQYRLVAHLGLAFLILGFAFWLGLEQLMHARATPLSADVDRQKLWARAFLGLLVVQILLGGFVAGTDAGLVYNTWPLMDGRLIPEGLFQIAPWYANFFENVTTIQFQHRLVAYAIAIAAIALWWRSQRIAFPKRTQTIAHCLLALVAVQIALGIATLLWVAALPLSALHQAAAIALFGTAVLYAFELEARGAN